MNSLISGFLVKIFFYSVNCLVKDPHVEEKLGKEIFF